MTYGRGLLPAHGYNIDGAAVSHLAELVRGDFFPPLGEGPLIRPFGPPSPQGEKGPRGQLRSPKAIAAVAIRIKPRRARLS
jgi:hypothetical protein